jgi:hypothetical protein
MIHADTLVDCAMSEKVVWMGLAFQVLEMEAAVLPWN